MYAVPNFNSHARVGRDVTDFILSHLYYNFNSHARVGRDPEQLECRMQQLNFNSHARVGRDCGMVDYAVAAHISTHTPAWGVTC